ncbi:MAG: hypothetical protein QXF26_07360 [Candidatus Bathyarchaeia archaeon]
MPTLQNRTVSVIVDRMVVSYKGVDDSRRNVNTYGEVRFRLRSEYDNTPVQTASVWINGSSATWDGVNQWWELSVSQSSAVKKNYVVTAATWAAYGITALNSGVASNSTSIIWDRVDVTISANTTLLKQGGTASFTITGKYEYDGNRVSPLTVNILRNSTHFATGNFTDTSSSPAIYFYTVENLTEATYGLTAFSSNTVNVTWTLFVNITHLDIYYDSTGLLNTYFKIVSTEDLTVGLYNNSILIHAENRTSSGGWVNGTIILPTTKELHSPVVVKAFNNRYTLSSDSNHTVSFRLNYTVSFTYIGFNGTYLFYRLIAADVKGRWGKIYFSTPSVNNATYSYLLYNTTSLALHTPINQDTALNFTFHIWRLAYVKNATFSNTDFTWKVYYIGGARAVHPKNATVSISYDSLPSAFYWRSNGSLFYYTVRPVLIAKNGRPTKLGLDYLYDIGLNIFTSLAGNETLQVFLSSPVAGAFSTPQLRLYASDVSAGYIFHARRVYDYGKVYVQIPYRCTNDFGVDLDSSITLLEIPEDVNTTEAVVVDENGRSYVPRWFGNNTALITLASIDSGQALTVYVRAEIPVDQFWLAPFTFLGVVMPVGQLFAIIFAAIIVIVFEVATRGRLGFWGAPLLLIIYLVAGAYTQTSPDFITFPSQVGPELLGAPTVLGLSSLELIIIIMVVMAFVAVISHRTGED